MKLKARNAEVIDEMKLRFYYRENIDEMQIKTKIYKLKFVLLF